MHLLDEAKFRSFADSHPFEHDSLVKAVYAEKKYRIPKKGFSKHLHPRDSLTDAADVYKILEPDGSIETRKVRRIEYFVR